MKILTPWSIRFKEVSEHRYEISSEVPRAKEPNLNKK